MIKDMDLMARQICTLEALSAKSADGTAYVVAVDDYETDIASGFSVAFPYEITGVGDMFVNMYRIGSVEKRLSMTFVVEGRDGVWYVPLRRPVNELSYLICGSPSDASGYVGAVLSDVWKLDGAALRAAEEIFDLEVNVRW